MGVGEKWKVDLDSAGRFVLKSIFVTKKNSKLKTNSTKSSENPAKFLKKSEWLTKSVSVGKKRMWIPLFSDF